MYNKYKELFRRIRERLGEERCVELSRKLQPGMLTYLDDGTEIDPQIVSLKDTPKKEVNENDIAEAIRTISYGMNIPVGEIVLSLKRLQRDRVAVYVLTKDMAERLKEQFGNPTKVYFSKEPIEIGPTSDEVFCEKQIFADTSTKKSYSDTRMLYTGVEFFRRHIKENTYTISGSCYFQARYDKQHEIANRNRHTSRHIPFYFKIFGKSRFVPRKNGGKDHTKFNRNVRPKGTHSHSKFYR
ncbi:hypothetical protein H6A66_14720 [Bacteroides caecigallinarum]|uniref:hypothetical protein n=1 Tax=Bacteroides caecigallinarum TaxID=1411144 RepID=UPI001957AB2B|nr:hypothetical protein [Bacteroides caecigallinarum]MBM6866410.1 hypothetical protein [Bacteroides caecigallinarum]